MFESPELLRAVDRLISADLTNLRDRYFGWLLLSSILVIVGVVLEGPELFHDIRGIVRKAKSEAEDWIKIVGLIGWVLVVVGVAGEGVFEFLLSKADGLVQESSGIELSGAIRRAAQAEGLARSFDLEISEARRDAAEAQERARKFELEAATMRKRAEDEAVARARIEDRIGGWRLTEATARRLMESMRPYAGTPYDLCTLPDTPYVDFTLTLDRALSLAGWLWKSPNAAFLVAKRACVATTTGLTVVVTTDRVAQWGKAADQLVAALRSAGISTVSKTIVAPDNNGINTNAAIHIGVGTRI